MKTHRWLDGPPLSQAAGTRYSYTCAGCGFKITYRVPEGRMAPSAEVVRRMAGPGVVPEDCDEALQIASVRRVHES